MSTLDQLNLPESPRVLVLAPHPDDEVFGCGGLLALLAADGAEIQVVIVTDGGYGEFGKDKEIRKSESLAAAEILGYPPPKFWDLPAFHLRFDEQLVRRVFDCIDGFKPNLVLAPSVWEVHPDHQALALATMEAARRGDRAGALLTYEVGSPLQANVLIDVSSVQERKQSAMHRFQSQLAVQAFDRHIDGLNRYRTYSLARGAVAAEAYHRPLASLLDFGGVNYLRLSASSGQQNLGPKVSILIRTTGRAELRESLQSAFLQTYSNLEIVVVNARSDAPIALPEHPLSVQVKLVEPGVRLGRSEAANRLLAECSGDFAIFLDDDDWFLPGHLSALANALERNPSAIAAYGDTVCVERQSGEWREIERFSGSVDIQRLAFENRLPIHAVMFCVKSVAGLAFDPEFDLFEDWDWWLKVARLGEMVHVPETGAVYRIHDLGGEGVRADPQRSLEALRQIVRKWHQDVELDLLIERLAYVRQALAALRKEQIRATRLVQAADEQALEIARVAQQHQAALARYEDAIRIRDEQIASDYSHLQFLTAQLEAARLQTSERAAGFADMVQQFEAEKLEHSKVRAELDEVRGQLKSLQAELKQTQSELGDSQHQLGRIYRSNSWRITRPVRGSARVVRQLTGLEARPGAPSQAPVTGASFKQALLAKARSSGMVRWLYYRLPIPESQKFKLRTWGRGVHRDQGQEPALLATAGDAGVAQRSADALAIRQAPTRAGDQSRSLPLVSVIIPCFNQGQFLIDSIGSAYAAYSGPLDIIVVNDGSTVPLTLRCLRDAAGLFPKIRIIDQENGGLSAARNTGIEAAKGAFIQFLDADDLIVPGKLDAQIQHMLADQLDVSICNYVIADASLKQHAKTDDTIAVHKSFELADFLYKWERSLSIPIHCGLFSRRALQEIRFSTELHAKEDWYFWCHLTRAGFIPKYADFHGAVYRMHDGSMRRSFVRMARQWMQAVTLLDRLVGAEYPDFFEQSVCWVNQYYRSNPIYQDEIKSVARVS